YPRKDNVRHLTFVPCMVAYCRPRRGHMSKCPRTRKLRRTGGARSWLRSSALVQLSHRPKAKPTRSPRVSRRKHNFALRTVRSAPRQEYRRCEKRSHENLSNPDEQDHALTCDCTRRNHRHLRRRNGRSTRAHAARSTKSTR